MIKVMLVDDHQVVRKGLKASILDKDDGVDVVCEAASGEEALEIIKKGIDLDLVVVDLSMPGMSGIEFTKKLKETQPHLGVLIFSIYDDKEYIIDAISAGAMGYLTKDALEDEIYNAIIRISQGKMYYSGSLTDILARQIITKSKQKSSTELKKITDREMQVLELIVQGFNNKEIAQKLIVSKRTVDNHRSNLMRKIGAKNTADIVRVAFEENLISL